MDRHPRSVLSTMAIILSFAITAVFGSGVAVGQEVIEFGHRWKPIQIGGGGWVTGLVVHPHKDGPVYCRTDVAGAYRWDEAGRKWVRLTTAERMPAEFMQMQVGNPGVNQTRAYPIESIAIAPSDVNVLFIASGHGTAAPGVVLKSVNGGKSFELTTLRTYMSGNGERRTNGERLAVKPDDAQVVLYGSRTDGLFRSTDGGTTWTKTAPDILPIGHGEEKDPVGISILLFDPNSPNTVFASVAGHGIYRSEDAGASWAKIGERSANAMKISQGVLYASSGQVTRLADGKWTDVTPKGRSIVEIAVDPTNSAHVVGITSGGQNILTTSDSGMNWQTLKAGSRSPDAQGYFQAPDTRWAENSTVRNWFSIGELEFDPKQPGRLWFAEGMGVWRTEEAKPGNVDTTFQKLSLGIEELCATDIYAAPGGRVVMTSWDRPGFVSTNLDVPPTSQFGLTDKFTTGCSLSAQNGWSNFVVACVSDHRFQVDDGAYSGFSRDGGATWQGFKSVDPETGRNTPRDLRFGEIVVSAGVSESPTLVWLPRMGKNDIYTSTNLGDSWTKVAVEGFKHMSAFYMTSRRALAADAVEADTYYLYSWESGTVLRSSGNTGQTWETRGKLPSYSYHCQLKPTPKKSGHLWFATGFDYTAPAPTRGLYRTKDAATSWERIDGFEEAWAIGFGRAQAAAGDPTIFVYGLRDKAWGIFRSTDDGATWTQISSYPVGVFDRVTAIAGDPETFGRVYLGFAGNGFAYGEPVGP